MLQCPVVQHEQQYEKYWRAHVLVFTIPGWCDKDEWEVAGEQIVGKKKMNDLDDFQLILLIFIM